MALMTNDQKQREARAARLALLPSTGHSKEIRARLREARKRRGMTLEQVADSIAEYDVAVPLSPRVAWIARALKGADDEIVDVVETILRRTLPLDPDE